MNPIADHTWTFKKITQQDIPTLYSWLKQEHVATWWPTPDGDEFFDHFLARIRSKDCFGFLVLLNQIPVGYVQYYNIDKNSEKTGSFLPDLPEQTVGIDQFIGQPDLVGKGYGTSMIKAFIKNLQTMQPMLTTIIVDPDPNNIAAIRCYKKVGFKSLEEISTPYGAALIMKKDLPQDAKQS